MCRMRPTRSPGTRHALGLELPEQPIARWRLTAWQSRAAETLPWKGKASWPTKD